VDVDEYAKVFRTGVLLASALLEIADLRNMNKIETELSEETYKEFLDSIDYIEAHIRDAFEEIVDIARSTKFD